MRNIEELKNALKNNVILVWNDPDPIEGNDYTINYVENIEEFESSWPILIQYGGGSEALVFLHEILVKNLAGKRVRLIEMIDQYPVEPGMTGTIRHQDDIGQLHIIWDNGRHLALVPGEDLYEILD